MAEPSARVVFPSDATVTKLAPVRDEVLKALAVSNTVALDLGKVRTFDLALLQFIISARLSAREAGKSLTFPALPNIEMVKMSIDLGLARPEGVGDEWPW